MRAFDVLTKADYDIRGSTQPRYHLEFALLRWVHLRRLVSTERHDSGAGEGRRARASCRLVCVRACTSASRSAGASSGHEASDVDCRHGARGRDEACRGHGGESSGQRRKRVGAGQASGAGRMQAITRHCPSPWRCRVLLHLRLAVVMPGLKEALLAELQKTKKFFYGTVIAQAQRIDVRKRAVSS